MWQRPSANSPIEPFIDICLNPLVPLIPSYVRDSTHFISLLETHLALHPITDQTLLATLDVSALYTNIPHAKGIQAVRKIMRLHSGVRVGDLRPKNFNHFA